mmetsp:Transcript_9180/g.31711  ORF Transcript_9180/g.31711 Transcript_9180/m.31711 type:complete len:222 (-) Transcript_9180:634-1299(-)
MGKLTSLFFLKFLLNLQRASASCSRSSCSRSGPLNCLTDSPMTCMSPISSATSAMISISSKSLNSLCSTLGCLTLTATTLPLWSPLASISLAPWSDSFALWTWAMLPLAQGSSSNHSNMSSILCPKAASTSFLVCAYLCDGTQVYRHSSSSHRSPGNMSRLVLAHCPHLTKAGPASSRALLTILFQVALPMSKCSESGAPIRMGRKRPTRYIPRSISDTLW